MEYKKDFNNWNKIKQRVENRTPAENFQAREVWRCSLGVNIGSEQDGKNQLYERPVLVIKRFNRNTLLILPLTRKVSYTRYSYKLKDESFVLLSQVRIVSSKRLLRKMFLVSKVQYFSIILKFILMIFK